MDNRIEKEAVKNFFNKNYQDRINYELCSNKKRIKVFNKLCHDFNILINNDYMEICNENEYSKIITKLKSYGAQNSCYVLSYNTLIDGQYMNLDEALKMVVGYGMPSLVICTPLHLAYFEAEQINGAPPRFILRRNLNE